MVYDANVKKFLLRSRLRIIKMRDECLSLSGLERIRGLANFFRTVIIRLINRSMRSDSRVIYGENKWEYFRFQYGGHKLQI